MLFRSVGVLKRFVDWVADAYVDIQIRHNNWRWLRSTFTFNTVANTDEYAYTVVTDLRLGTIISRFSRWLVRDERGLSNITFYLTSAGVSSEVYLTPLAWANFRYIYKRGAQSALTNKPVHITITPQNTLMLGPNPNGIYTVKGEYQMSAQTLALNSDVPEMPSDYHDLILYRAMEKASYDIVAVELLERAGKEGSRLTRALEFNQLPPITLAEPMV